MEINELVKLSLSLFPLTASYSVLTNLNAVAPKQQLDLCPNNPVTSATATMILVHSAKSVFPEIKLSY